MSFTICDHDLCCGCALCADVCPHGAIRITRDVHGFARPEIDPSLCVGCGACRAKCPVNCENESRAEKVYAAYAKDKEIRRKSSSGGIFRLLANKTLEDGGAVAAVGYDGKFHALYKVTDRPEGLDEMMGSKYTEALSDGIYGKVKTLLSDGKKVLFVGTPCRVAALKSFVGDRENLLAVDFICHGVPSPVLLEKFLSENFGKDIERVSFRDKTRGWQEFSMRVDEAGKKPYINSQYKDPYLRVFLCNTALRESCYDCRFKAEHYASDITLGDFWGISSCIPSMNDDGGTSAVVIRSAKGSSAFDEIKYFLVLKETSPETLGKANIALNKSSLKPAARGDMLLALERGDTFSAIAEKFGRPAPSRAIISERMKRSVKKILGKIKK